MAGCKTLTVSYPEIGRGFVIMRTDFICIPEKIRGFIIVHSRSLWNHPFVRPTCYRVYCFQASQVGDSPRVLTLEGSAFLGLWGGPINMEENTSKRVLSDCSFWCFLNTYPTKEMINASNWRDFHLSLRSFEMFFKRWVSPKQKPTENINAAEPGQNSFDHLGCRWQHTNQVQGNVGSVKTRQIFPCVFGPSCRFII